MNRNVVIKLSIIFVLITTLSCSNIPQGEANAIKNNILPLRERAKIQDEWLKWRLENILPEIMKKHDMDMWLVINREYNEDPVYFTLVSQPTINSYRTTILVFHRQDDELKRLAVGRYGRGLYEGLPKEPSQKQFEALAEYIRQANPEKIGINVSRNWHLADGLSVTMKEMLTDALGEELSKRLVSTEGVCIDWLQTRSPQEISEYKNICRIGHAVIADVFSSETIIPDKTSLEDLRWYVRDKIQGLGLETWFQPIMDIQRSDADAEKYKDNPDIIRKGDLLHCDVGVTYLGLNSDMQWHAYVLRDGEDDAPEGFKKALQRTIEFNKILRGEFKEGVNGVEIGNAAMEKGKAAGLNPLVYSHSLGTHGHAAGLRIDTRPIERVAEENPVRRKYALVLNTVYAIEYCCYENIPEWDGKEVEMSFEDDAVFTKDGCEFLDGHQKEFILIK